MPIYYLHLDTVGLNIDRTTWGNMQMEAADYGFIFVDDARPPVLVLRGSAVQLQDEYAESTLGILSPHGAAYTSMLSVAASSYSP